MIFVNLILGILMFVKPKVKKFSFLYVYTFISSIVYVLFFFEKFRNKRQIIVYFMIELLILLYFFIKNREVIRSKLNFDKKKIILLPVIFISFYAVSFMTFKLNGFTFRILSLFIGSLILKKCIFYVINALGIVLFCTLYRQFIASRFLGLVKYISKVSKLDDDKNVKSKKLGLIFVIVGFLISIVVLITREKLGEFLRILTDGYVGQLGQYITYAIIIGLIISIAFIIVGIIFINKSRQNDALPINESDSSYEKLKSYKKMLDDGLITEEEYNMKKKSLMEE